MADAGDCGKKFGKKVRLLPVSTSGELCALTRVTASGDRRTDRSIDRVQGTAL